MLVTMPFLLLLLDVWPLGRTSLAPAERPGAAARSAPWSRLVVEKVPFLAAALGVIALVVRSFQWTVEELPLSLRAANAVTSYWAYLGKLVWPSALAVYYPNPSQIPAWKTAAAVAGLALASALLVVARRRLSLGALVGWCWFLGTMLPVSGIVRNGLWPAMADRFMYFPIVGALIGIAWGAGTIVERVPRAKIPVAAALVAALAASTVRSHLQARCWRTSSTLFRNAVEATPPSRFVWSNYGTLLQAEGRVAEARAWWEQMIRTLPDAPDGYLNLGAMWHAAGALPQAEAAYRVALEKDPRCGHAYYNLALLDKRKGDVALALAGFERARAVGLRDAAVLEHIGELAATLGRQSEAEDAFSEAFRGDPMNWRAGVGLGRLLAGIGRSGEAQAVLHEAWLRAQRAGEAEVARQAGLGSGW
jgi:protein O-mannosyl-transferase